jgi:hypothetical protein
MRTILLAATVAAATALCGCGGSRATSKTTSHSSSTATTSTPTLCGNATQCSTQTSGQLMSGVTISNSSNVPAVMDALHQEYNTQLQSADQQTGFALVQSQCAPVGSLGQFPANDYLCGGVVESTSDGQDSYALPTLFNVRSDGTVYAVGSPCTDSTPASCDPTYWSMVQSQAVAASTAAATAPTPTTSTGPSPVSCGAFNDPSAAAGDPKHYSNVTAVGTSCATARAVAFSAGQAPGSSGGPAAAEGWACSYPTDPGSPYGQCTNGSGSEVDLYTNGG